MQKSWDVVVIGAGVAGGMAAYDCARRGLTVLLVEKRSFPRWKVCGCCFNANAIVFYFDNDHLLDGLIFC